MRSAPALYDGSIYDHQDTKSWYIIENSVERALAIPLTEPHRVRVFLLSKHDDIELLSTQKSDAVLEDCSFVASWICDMRSLPAGIKIHRVTERQYNHLNRQVIRLSSLKKHWEARCVAKKDLARTRLMERWLKNKPDFFANYKRSYATYKDFSRKYNNILKGVNHGKAVYVPIVFDDFFMPAKFAKHIKSGGCVYKRTIA